MGVRPLRRLHARARLGRGASARRSLADVVRDPACDDRVDGDRVRLALLVDDRIEVQVHAWRDRLWARVSAQVYNDMSDIVRLAEAVTRHAPVRAAHA